MKMDFFLFDMNKIDIAKTDLNLLKVFEALYGEGSASLAATRLALTQSAVSTALKRLRDVDGDPLFQRTGRGLAPTLLAQQLKPVVSEVLHKIRQSLAMVSPSGRSLDLAISSGGCKKWVEPMSTRRGELRLCGGS
ncbi:MAG: LysR family transcriptional regulator [Halomonas sp.]|uniref:LysR family transcriptional regulator n=1 Tax=Halomonas sp. TaxID=1486246 RepID=UPI003F912990